MSPHWDCCERTQSAASDNELVTARNSICVRDSAETSAVHPFQASETACPLRPAGPNPVLGFAYTAEAIA